MESVQLASRLAHDVHSGDTPSTSRTNGTTARQKKVWEEWPGSQLFFADGHFVVSQKWPGALGTILLVLAIEGAFMGLVAAKLKSPYGIIAVVSGAALTIITCSFALRTCLMDPGMLPKLPPSEQYLRDELPRIRNFAHKGSTITIKYDDTYHFYRPPRAHHCRVTNVVIDRFDHFCPWMGNTIGARNYRSFLLFLVATSVQITVTVGFCVLHVVQHLRDTRGESANGGLSGDDPKVVDIIGTPAVGLIAGIFGLLVNGLLLFHLSLIWKGQTTYESIERSGSVYSDGCSQNCYNAWCLPTPPPYVDFSKAIEEADRTDPPEIIKMCNPPWHDADGLRRNAA